MSVLERVEHLLHERGARQMEVRGRSVERIARRTRHGVVAESLEHTPFVGADRRRGARAVAAGRSSRRRLRLTAIAVLASPTSSFHEAAALATGSPSVAVSASMLLMCASVCRVALWRSRLSTCRTRRNGQMSAAVTGLPSTPPMIFCSSPQ